jgi:hypothetical protein
VAWLREAGVDVQNMIGKDEDCGKSHPFDANGGKITETTNGP